MENLQAKKKKEELLLEAKSFIEENKKAIQEAVRTDQNAIRIPFALITEFSPDLSEHVLENPQQTTLLIEEAIQDAGLKDKARLRLTEIPKSAKIAVRNIRAKQLDKLIQIEGIIRQASDVRPQVTNAKFECPSCGAILSVLQIDKKFREPNRCTCQWKGPFTTLSKEMVDTQRLVIEESPDSLEGGEQPRRINVFLQEDLVEPKMEERTTPGSRVAVIGTLKEVPIPLQTGAVSTRYDIAIEANNLIPLEETFDNLEINEEETKQILEIATRPEVFRDLSESIAPSIYGFKEQKEAVLLQLFGGVRKKKTDGGHTRGDIHVLMVGDPGVAKSVLLKFASNIGPKGRYVSGRAASAAGLTAAVIKDEFMRGWSLEAGAMVLSNKGVVCLDEIEKMTEQDRSAMHEAMEQQTVTVSKANIQATLRSETTVLAAGNPKLGRFDPHTPITQQIDITPALMSRFDVIFVVRDIPNKTQDEAIASHVLAEHKQSITHDVIDPKLLRKYVAYARKNCHPKLTDEAITEIKNFYITLRGQSSKIEGGGVKPLAITARQLEGIIRISEACAKARLSDEVQKRDARQAIDLIFYSLKQVGYDEETKTFDIDRITTGITASRRGKIVSVREALAKLETTHGKMIPEEAIEKELENKISPLELEDALNQLAKSGDIFKPRKGYVQRM